MRRCSLLFVFALFAVLAAAPALAQDDISGDGSDSGPAVLCEGTYALCIIAPCEEVETSDGGRMAECACDVIEDSPDSPAWSIGPGSCEDRVPVETDGRTVLISTYSNLYNGDNQVAVCDEAIEWAWCYGAKCVVDPADPSKAICNCPIENSPANILGDCADELCANGLWSAATAAESCFANCDYYRQMEDHGGANPPAAACPGDSVCECPEPEPPNA
jgi:hypothetical protein